ncbi:signal peptidase I [[Eubacterium] cellulosolvens]
MTGDRNIAGLGILSHSLGRVRKNPIARVLILVGLVFVVTYGGMAVARIVMETESPIMVVPSTSMVPTLNVGDIVIVKGVDPNTITVGTVIIFRSPGGAIDIIHRVVGIVKVGDTLYFQTKGDHNASPDPWSPGVPETNVKGVLVARIPYIGYVTLALQGPLGIILIAFLIFLMIVFEYYDSRKKASQRNR